jgi:hypothetical protein
MTIKIVNVAVGVIKKNNAIFICKRADEQHQGGLWEFQTPKEFKAQIEDGPNTFNFSTRHIEVKIVGKSKDVAYANYYLVGTITGPNKKLIASNYRTRASAIYLKKSGKWVSYGQHFSPLYGGSGVIFE